MTPSPLAIEEELVRMERTLAEPGTLLPGVRFDSELPGPREGSPPPGKRVDPPRLRECSLRMEADSKPDTTTSERTRAGLQAAPLGAAESGRAIPGRVGNNLERSIRYIV